MEFFNFPNKNIVPYNGDSPMKPWPSLAENAFYLMNSSRPGEKIFFYDSGPKENAGSSPAVFVMIHGLGTKPIPGGI